MARLINAAGFTWLRVTCTIKKQPRRGKSTRIYRGQVLPRHPVRASPPALPSS
jgi:hypothetical protein